MPPEVRGLANPGLPGDAPRCDTCGGEKTWFNGDRRVPCPACTDSTSSPPAVQPCTNGVAPINGKGQAHTPRPAEQPVPAVELEPCGWEPVDLTGALKRDGPLPPAVLERGDSTFLLYPGRTHAFIGEPEGMKSWGWQVAAAQLLAAGRPVLVLDFENDEDAVVERLRALGVHDEDILAQLTYIRPEGPWEDLTANRLAELRAEGRFVLVVVDGVTDGMATLKLDPDKNKDAATFDRMLVKPFARAGAAVVLTDHVVKDREGRGRYAIGAQHKLAAIDGATFVFEVIASFGREREGVARIELTKDKPGWLRRNATGKTIAMLRLTSYPDGGVTGGFELPNSKVTGPFRPTALMEKASRAAEEQPGLTKRSLRSAVGGNAEHADHAIELLTIEDYITVERGPGNSLKHFSAKPYRRDDDPCGTETPK